MAVTREVKCTMISHVKLRRVLKGRKLATIRLDCILTKKPNFLDVNKKKKEEEFSQEDFLMSDTFHNAIGPILMIGQCFGSMPVVGVMRPNPKDVRFTLRCAQSVYAALFIFFGMLFTVAMMKTLFRIGIDPKNLIGLSFFMCVFLANILFFSLARRWPNLIQKWSRVEVVFLKKPYNKLRKNLSTRVQSAVSVFMILSLVEHALHHISSVYGYNKQIKLCNRTDGPSFNHFMKQKYDYIYGLVPYNVEIGVVTLIINFAFTFTWNYMDLFIMMASKGIAYRFEQISARIKSLSNDEIPECVFTEIREHYVRLCELLECVDENLSGIILLSSMNNLYFVCSQLLNIFNKLRWPINYVYFWYSLLYLMGRTAFVLLAAASINDQSKAPVSMLRRVSEKTWCIEVERLIYQMSTQTVALSGKKFYFLTRRLLFGMAGTIVTYELVLLQFDEPNRSKGLPDLCS